MEENNDKKQINSWNVYGCYEAESGKNNEGNEERLMGADIWMFIEHKNSETNKWNLVKNSEWSHNMVPIDRNSGLFHILCGYDKKNFNELSVICECKGLPSDIDKETAFWLENLAYTSYLSLDEIQNFNWNKEVYYFEEDCKHSAIAREFYTEIIPYMLSMDTNHQNVRIVFGLSL